MNQLVPISDNAAAVMERVIISGDLAKLSPQERVNYYSEVCKSVGLNPLTRPFEYITLNSKLTLYALRACTDQLRSIYAVSVEEMIESEREGVFIVTAKVRNGEGRTDIAKGAVNIGGLKGEALANAMMKAETKAKRRATLSLCGLGWLDESEVDSIPGAVRGETQPAPPAISPPSPPPAPQTETRPPMTPQVWAQMGIDRLATFNSKEELAAFEEKYTDKIARLADVIPDMHKKLVDAISDRHFVLDYQ